MKYTKLRVELGLVIEDLYLKEFNSGNMIAKKLSINKGAVYRYLKEKRLLRNKKEAGKLVSKFHKPYNRLGKKNPKWKGGKNYDKDGYVLIYDPIHPNSRNKKYVLEHRLVMEKHLGRYLRKSEVVHHINENKQNNKIDNLMLFPTQKAHVTFIIQLKKGGYKHGRRKNCHK